jgi:UDP-3-O-[3-hydroxymyristoyl] glucosamine N-acyltransferase
VYLGQEVTIHSGAVIGADGFGFRPRHDGSLHKIPQVGRVRIGNNVEIGANTCIDRATVGDTIIEDGVKLDNLVQIGHNSVVGAYTVMAGQAGLSGSVRVGTGVRIAGQVGIADHVTLGDFVTILAQSGVGSDVAAGDIMFGSPALPSHLAKRQHVYSAKLGALFQQVKQLQRRVEELEGREKTP